MFLYLAAKMAAPYAGGIFEEIQFICLKLNCKASLSDFRKKLFLITLPFADKIIFFDL